MRILATTETGTKPYTIEKRYLVEEGPNYKNCFFQPRHSYGQSEAVLRLATPWKYYIVVESQNETCGICAIRPYFMLFAKGRYIGDRTVFRQVPLPNCGDEGYTCCRIIRNPLEGNIPLLLKQMLTEFWSERFTHEEIASTSKDKLYELVNKQFSTRSVELEPYQYWEQNYNLATINDAPFMRPVNLFYHKDILANCDYNAEHIKIKCD